MNSKNFTKKALASIIAIASVFASAVPAVAADSSTSNVEETSDIETAKAELKTLIDKFNSVDVDENNKSNRKYTSDTITDSTIWAALSDAYYVAETYYIQPTSTLEEVNACINTFTTAFEKADKFIADAEEAKKKAEDEANQAKVAGVKDEISKLLAGITVEEQDLFPSVWEVLNTAMTNANNAINNDELVYSEAIEVKSTLESAISDATKNAEVKATVDEAKKKLGQTINNINFNENTVNAIRETVL